MVRIRLFRRQGHSAMTILFCPSKRVHHLERDEENHIRVATDEIVITYPITELSYGSTALQRIHHGLEIACGEFAPPHRSESTARNRRKANFSSSLCAMAAKPTVSPLSQVAYVRQPNLENTQIFCFHCCDLKKQKMNPFKMQRTFQISQGRLR